MVNCVPQHPSYSQSTILPEGPRAQVTYLKGTSSGPCPKVTSFLTKDIKSVPFAKRDCRVPEDSRSPRRLHHAPKRAFAPFWGETAETHSQKELRSRLNNDHLRTKKG